MSLIAVAAVLLFAQTEAPAPTYREADVARLERCVYGGADVARCGSFSEDVRVLEACTGRADLAGGVEGFGEAWWTCDSALPCHLEKPQPDQGTLVLRNCAARDVAARKLIAARWLAQLEARLTPEDRALLAQLEKILLAGPEAPAAGDDPLQASAYWSVGWSSYLMFLRLAQITGKAGI